ncbi:class I SAM-dependent methyltransferase [Paenibacillus xylaniclasticus]|uniref:class I SAM-dependent methyltransferase n=1 Tax=Paenibacillus xylaniclasticus TaxID=588083 RepID=UPI000FDB62E1|nr:MULTISPECIES: class I SAM-dependent methyltransferase [Paenibacillus]GFN31613.1 methyltransferase type 11 [Paenibacillus curdlanolyticus]
MTNAHERRQQQTWRPEIYDQDMAFVSTYGAPLVDLLNPKPYETVIDWGCGTGELASAIAARGAIVTAIDFSEEMIASAKAKYPSIAFLTADGQKYRAEHPVDAVFSNAALHWMTDAEGTAASIGASLKPGGRFVAELGGSGNINTVVEGLRESFAALNVRKPFVVPWYFPTIGEYSAVLEQAGFEVRTASLFDRPTLQAGGDKGLRGWLAMFADGILSGLSGEEAEAVVRMTEERARPSLYRDGQWFLDYRRLRVTAVRK